MLQRTTAEGMHGRSCMLLDSSEWRRNANEVPEARRINAFRRRSGMRGMERERGGWKWRGERGCQGQQVLSAACCSQSPNICLMQRQPHAFSFSLPCLFCLFFLSLPHMPQRVMGGSHVCLMPKGTESFAMPCQHTCLSVPVPCHTHVTLPTHLSVRVSTHQKPGM